jgi:hypothetical protein
MATARAASFGFVSGHVEAQLADPRFAILFGNVAAQEHQFAGLHKRHIGCGRNGDRGQGDGQCFELV